MSSGATGAELINVLIADDHPMVRRGLRFILGNEPDIRLVGEASDGLEAEALAVRHKPDVVVLDMSMPTMNGIESMLKIKQSLPAAKFLFLTVSENEEDLLQAVRLGADGYLLKKIDLSDVVDAVRKVAAGEAILSQEMTARLFQELRAGPDQPSLSPREKEVLRLVGEGLTNKAIAERIIVSEGTVNTYVHRLLEKLHLKNRAEAIVYAMRHGSRTAAK